MKITMIGDAAVGKTTFMITTYGLMRDGIQGFKVKCKNPQVDVKLNQAFQQFCRNGVYPDGTVKMSSYNYDFYSDRDWVMNFTLTDIRGESIHDLDVTELQREIRSSDAVMLFLSAYDILNGVDIEDSIDELYTHLNNSFVVDERVKLLMVVFTQSDRIELNEENFQILMDSVAELDQMASKNDNMLFIPVPTACSPQCMMDLDYAMVVLMMTGYIREVTERKKTIEKELEDIQRQWGGGFWRELKFWLIGDAERNKAAKRAKQLQDEEIPKYTKMQQKFEKMKKFFDDYKVGTSYCVNAQEDPFDF